MVQTNTKVIQAFPVHSGTMVFTSGVSGFEPKGYNLIHAQADTTVTFNFGGAGTVVIDMVAGEDLAFHECVTIESTASCIIS